MEGGCYVHVAMGPSRFCSDVMLHGGDNGVRE